MSEQTILIVEGEKTLGKSILERLEARSSDCAVIGADSAEDALRIVTGSQIDLVVSDHGGVGRIDGLEIVRGIRDSGVATKVVLSSDDDRSNDRIKALSMGCVCFLVKPHPTDKLLDMLLKMLEPQYGFSGGVVGIRLEDVIQMFCYRKDSTLLLISEGDRKGCIYVNEGGIIHAECDSLSGVEAFFEIIGWERGQFLSQVVFDVPERTVFMDWQSLVMEGMRLKDEVRHALGPITGARARAEVVEDRNARIDAVAESAKRIMVVDDSRFIRKIVQEILESDPALTVAGYAANGQEALEKIDELKPDLILLDWDMPVMKGSTALMHIMIRSPCPVVILSGFVGGVGANPFDLLCLGAVDFLRKPQNNWRRDGRAEDLVFRVKEASGIRYDRIRRVRIPSLTNQARPSVQQSRPSKSLSVFSSSTGGCSDLIRIIPSLSHELPTAVVILHDMQESAVGAFIDYLDRRSGVRVIPAESGAPLLDGVCYVHPASVPLEVTRQEGRLWLKVTSQVSGADAVDHFLISAAKIVGGNLLAAMLSGGPTGRGTVGFRAVKEAAGITAVQDPASCTDPRMAEHAVREGIIDHTWPADMLAATLEELVS